MARRQPGTLLAFLHRSCGRGNLLLRREENTGPSPPRGSVGRTLRLPDLLVHASGGASALRLSVSHQISAGTELAGDAFSHVYSRAAHRPRSQNGRRPAIDRSDIPQVMWAPQAISPNMEP